jgi:superfamily I DNA/RNA helicase
MGEPVDPSAQDEATRLCSIHHSKGREWRAVFVAGAEEGLVPHHNTLQDDDALDGELRRVGGVVLRTLSSTLAV